MGKSHSITTLVCTLGITLLGHAPNSEEPTVAVATDATNGQVVAHSAPDSGVQLIVISNDLADPTELLPDGQDVHTGFAVPPWWHAALRDLRGPQMATSSCPLQTHSIALVLRC